MKREIPKPSITALWESYGGRVLGGNSGGWQKATCVLHQDSNPSASINEDECRWHCWTCDASGDAIDLIMRVENAGWSDAKSIAEGFADGEDGGVRAERGSSSLLPPRPGSRPGRRNWVPPWRGL